MLETPEDHGGDASEFRAAPRMALLVTLGVLGGHTLVTVLNVLGRSPGLGELTVLIVALAAILTLQFAHSTRQPRTWPVRVRVLTLSAQAVATYLPFAWLGLPWGAMTGLLAGSVLLAVRNRLRWPLYAAVIAGTVLVVVALGGLGGALYALGATILASLIIFGVSSLSGLVATTLDTRRALADMAVVQERLRVAGDLHDLLGYSLSAITLKSELGHRLLPAAPDRARSEVAEVLSTASEALADVRLVTTGYRNMSLAAEAESALSVLSAAQITAEAELPRHLPPREVDNVLAIVLREAVTNVLRHSKAGHCTITAAEEGERWWLRIRNDGVAEGRSDTDAEGGSGIANLTTRLHAIGGEVSAGPTADGGFQIAAHAPAVPRDADLRVEPESEGHRRSGPHWAPRMARSMLLAILGGYTLITMVNVAGRTESGSAVLGFFGCLAVVVTLQTLHSLRQARTWPVGMRVLTLALQAAATYAPLLWLDGPWGSMAGFLAGSLLILVPGTLRLVLYAAAVAVVGPLAAAGGAPLVDIVYLVDSSLVAGLVVYGFTVLYRLVVELHEARDSLVRLAVARERLIVERELHEVLGSSLSTVAMKCALIHRLLPRSPGPAREELETVLGLSRRALADVRLVARGYRGQPSMRDPSANRERLAEFAVPDEPPYRIQLTDTTVSAVMSDCGICTHPSLDGKWTGTGGESAHQNSPGRRHAHGAWRTGRAART